MVRRTAGLVLIGMAMTALTACAAGSSKASSATPTRGGGEMQAYVACLSDHGVKLPSFARPSTRPSARPSGVPRPSGGLGFGGGFGGRDGGFFDSNNPPAGVDAATWKSALTACAATRPTFSGISPDNSQFVAYRNCLQSHGITLGADTRLNTSDPKTAAALKTCAPLRPTRTPDLNRSASASPTS